MEGSWDHDVGSYTLTVAYSDIADDHGDDIDDATRQRWEWALRAL